MLREEAALAPLALDLRYLALSCCRWAPGDLRAICWPVRALGTRRCWHPNLTAGVTRSARRSTLPFTVPDRFHRCDPVTAYTRAGGGPYAVLREAERVLTGEGCLMICGFNHVRRGSQGAPAMPFGCSFGRPGSRRTREALLLSGRRLRDWVALLGFDVDSGSMAIWDSCPRRRGLERGAAAAPLTPRATCSKARKRVSTLTTIRPRRRVRQRVLVGAAGPTNKVGS